MSKIIAITGANSGLGYEASIRLAREGNTVVMLCRNPKKAEEGAKSIVAKAKCAPERVKFVQLDTADLDNVAGFRSRYVQAMGGETPIDVLVLNAGIMATPARGESPQGIELQMATNCVGHYALLGQVLDLVRKAPNGGRVVFLSSIMHMFAPRGGIDFNDFNADKGKYDTWKVYGETKLGMLLMMHKLNRVLAENKVDNVLCVGAHPGYSATNLQKGINRLGNIVAMSATTGAHCIYLAATDPSPPRDGLYCGPWIFNVWGTSVWHSRQTSYAKDEALQDKFWAKMAELTKVNVAASASKI